MRYLEPAVKEALTYEGQTTTEITQAIFGNEDWKVSRERSKVYNALVSVRGSGGCESRICRIDKSTPAATYWALPGGRFPEGIGPEISERLLSILDKDRFKRTDIIFSELYSDREVDDRTQAMKRINRALNRLKDAHLVEKGDIETCDGTPFSTWRLL